MKAILPLRALAAELRQARRILVITGDGVTIEEALSGEMMRTRPELCWKNLGEIERACRGCQPNAGHRVLAELAPAYEQFTVLTQNVDGFHRRAGRRDRSRSTATCTGCTAVSAPRPASGGRPGAWPAR